MSDPLHYSVRLRTGNGEWYLLWKDGGDKPDAYITLPRSTNLLIARTRSDLAKLAMQRKLPVSDASPHLVDIAMMQRALERLRPDRTVSQQTSQILLESWNDLEDLARSVRSVPANALREKEIKRVYDKLFYGNNLPSVTPAGKSFLPAFTKQELVVLRKFLRATWQGICDRVELFQGS